MSAETKASVRQFMDRQSFTVRPGDKLADVERKLIINTLACSESKQEAAESLGISLRTLYNRLDQYAREK